MGFEQVRLPIGIRKDGGIFREVLVDEMTGVDEEILSNPKYKQAPIRAFVAVLQRCVQGIPGLIEQKQDPFSLAPLEFLRSMYQIDRDYLLAQIRRISFGDEVMSDWTCKWCDVPNQDQIKISELPVVEWPDDKPTSIPFEIAEGILVDGKIARKGVLRLLDGVDAERVANTMQRTPEGVSTALLAAMLESLEGMEKPSIAALRRMRSKDRNRLAEIARDVSPGMSMTKDMTCASCGRINERVQLEASGFFSATSEKSRKRGNLEDLESPR